jgi:hypothetical protein
MKSEIIHTIREFIKRVISYFLTNCNCCLNIFLLIIVWIWSLLLFRYVLVALEEARMPAYVYLSEHRMYEIFHGYYEGVTVVYLWT